MTIKEPQAREVPSLIEIKQAIPAHLFQSNLFKSLTYVVRSTVCVLALGFALYLAHRQLLPYLLSTMGETQAYIIFGCLLALYWFLQGTVFWGLFTLGHDCGHGSFSKYHWVNWVMGILLHTFILVPYDSWRMSHRHHHKNTGNLDTDEIFYPMRVKEADDHWVTRWMGFTFGGAWFCYLLVGSPPRQVYHFNPLDPLWGNEKHTVVVSVLCWVAWAAVVGSAMNAVGAALVAMYYLAPVYVFASWLVLVTFLHHNGEGMTWYAGRQWDYVRGNLSSVDRDYGIFNSIIHNIGTHQIHHLFPIIPHYHLLEATAHFRRAFPHLAADLTSRRILPEFWRNMWVYARLGGSCPPKATIFSYDSLMQSMKKKI